MAMKIWLLYFHAKRLVSQIFAYPSSHSIFGAVLALYASTAHPRIFYSLNNWSNFFFLP